jgi:hypothetical protein
MHLHILALLVLTFALSILAAPVDDCEFLEPLSVLQGARDFCGVKYPVANAASIFKSNAKRYGADDTRVMRILGGMPRSRQKRFCACYPAPVTRRRN